jgi:hypothetical protein
MFIKLTPSKFSDLEILEACGRLVKFFDNSKLDRFVEQHIKPVFTLTNFSAKLPSAASVVALAWSLAQCYKTFERLSL